MSAIQVDNPALSREGTGPWKTYIPKGVKMEANCDKKEDLQKIIQELKEDIADIYQFYHGDPPHLQKIFAKWVIEE
jgi:hypothetical protein